MYLPDAARKHLSTLTALFLAVALYPTTQLDGTGSIGSVYVGSAFSVLVKQILLFATLLCVLGGKEWLSQTFTKARRVSLPGSHVSLWNDAAAGRA